jgi:hypothetical protein
MTEVIRYGDLYGYDDAEVIQDDDASLVVIDTSNSEGSEENADVK